MGQLEKEAKLDQEVSGVKEVKEVVRGSPDLKVTLVNQDHRVQLAHLDRMVPKVSGVLLVSQACQESLGRMASEANLVKEDHLVKMDLQDLLVNLVLLDHLVLPVRLAQLVKQVRQDHLVYQVNQDALERQEKKAHQVN
jgi:hypothetical protein